MPGQQSGSSHQAVGLKGCVYYTMTAVDDDHRDPLVYQDPLVYCLIRNSLVLNYIGVNSSMGEVTLRKSLISGNNQRSRYTASRFEAYDSLNPIQEMFSTLTIDVARKRSRPLSKPTTFSERIDETYKLMWVSL